MISDDRMLKRAKIACLCIMSGSALGMLLLGGRSSSSECFDGSTVPEPTTTTTQVQVQIYGMYDTEPQPAQTDFTPLAVAPSPVPECTTESDQTIVDSTAQTPKCDTVIAAPDSQSSSEASTPLEQSTDDNASANPK
jgi:hypothetical protein